MKFSLCVEMLYQNFDFFEKFNAASYDGFEYCEFWRWRDRDWDLLKKSIVKSKVKISAFSGDDEFSPIDSKEKSSYIDFLKKSIKKAVSIQCPNLVIHSDALDPKDGSAKQVSKLSYEQKLINLYDVLKEAAELAEKSDITLLLEPLNTRIDHENYFLSDPDRAFEIIDAVKSDKVKLLFDIYHMQIMKGDIIHRIHKSIESIGYIHVADVPGRHEPGTGELNLASIIGHLKNICYDGFVGFELSPLSDNDLAINAIRGIMQEVINN